MCALAQRVRHDGCGDSDRGGVTVKSKKHVRSTRNPETELEKASAAFDTARQELADYEAGDKRDPKRLAKLQKNLATARARSDRAYRAVSKRQLVAA